MSGDTLTITKGRTREVKEFTIVQVDNHDKINKGWCVLGLEPKDVPCINAVLAPKLTAPLDDTAEVADALSGEHGEVKDY